MRTLTALLLLATTADAATMMWETTEHQALMRRLISLGQDGASDQYVTEWATFEGGLTFDDETMQLTIDYWGYDSRALPNADPVPVVEIQPTSTIMEFIGTRQLQYYGGHTLNDYEGTLQATELHSGHSWEWHADLTTSATRRLSNYLTLKPTPANATLPWTQNGFDPVNPDGWYTVRLRSQIWPVIPEPGTFVLVVISILGASWHGRYDYNAAT